MNAIAYQRHECLVNLNGEWRTGLTKTISYVYKHPLFFLLRYFSCTYLYYLTIVLAPKPFVVVLYVCAAVPLRFRKKYYPVF